jgi:hypothetical protein
VALFETTQAHEAVIYSGLCTPDESLAGMRMASRVRVRCITGSDRARFCKRTGEADEFNEQTFSPGVRPEFPSRIYVVEGHLSSPRKVDGSALVFDNLDAQKIQQLPREMIGAFLQYPKDRPAFITEYLREGAYNEAGNRNVF